MAGSHLGQKKISGLCVSCVTRAFPVRRQASFAPVSQKIRFQGPRPEPIQAGCQAPFTRVWYSNVSTSPGRTTVKLTISVGALLFRCFIHIFIRKSYLKEIHEFLWLVLTCFHKTEKNSSQNNLFLHLQSTVSQCLIRLNSCCCQWLSTVGLFLRCIK